MSLLACAHSTLRIILIYFYNNKKNEFIYLAAFEKLFILAYSFMNSSITVVYLQLL
jgi:hypothetical protein